MTSRLASRIALAADRSVELWGEAAQWDIVVEECAELIAEINRQRRGRSSMYRVAGELADVLLAANKLRWLLSQKGVDVGPLLLQKLERLEGRLDDAQEQLEPPPPASRVEEQTPEPEPDPPVASPLPPSETRDLEEAP